MNIIKSNGSAAPFDRQKVIDSIMRTGATKKIADEVIERVEPQVREGMTTRELYGIVRKELGEVNTCFGCRYNLREAILKLGPAGFKFEKYVSSILRAYRYEAMNPHEDLPGACTRHEIDVIAEKDSRKIFIEAKFRNDYLDNVDLKDTMATWSRFLDLVDGSAVNEETPHFEECWIVTNARFSDRARQFGDCKGIRMIGWNHPPDMTFATMVDHVAIYPITVMDRLTQEEIDAFAEHDLMLCREISESDPLELSERLGLKPERLQEIVHLCGEIVAGHQDPRHSHTSAKKPTSKR